MEFYRVVKDRSSIPATRQYHPPSNSSQPSGIALIFKSPNDREASYQSFEIHSTQHNLAWLSNDIVEMKPDKTNESGIPNGIRTLLM
jgi:hypothetical protein